MKTCNDRDYELREIQRLEGHSGKVLGVAWKKKTGIWGRPALIASWSDDKTIRIWEQNFSGSFVCKAVLEVSCIVKSCAWSPQSQLLAVACSDATTAIWKNVGVHAYEHIYTLKGHDNEVRSVAWNDKGDLLATCGGDKSVWIWEVLPGNEFDCVFVLQGHNEDVNIVAWDEDVLFSGSSDNTIKVWRERIDDDDGAGDWYCDQTFSESDGGHTSTVRSLAPISFTQDVVSCSDDLTIKIWIHQEIGHWLQGCTLSGYHDTAIFSVDWFRVQEYIEGDIGPDTIASAGADDAIRVFMKNKDNEVDGLTFELLLKKEKAHEMNVNSVKWQVGDRKLLASASDDGTVKIWDFI